jgi:hypothetical protein
MRTPSKFSNLAIGMQSGAVSIRLLQARSNPASGLPGCRPVDQRDGGPAIGAGRQGRGSCAAHCSIHECHGASQHPSLDAPDHQISLFLDSLSRHRIRLCCPNHGSSLVGLRHWSASTEATDGKSSPADPIHAHGRTTSSTDLTTFDRSLRSNAARF